MSKIIIIFLVVLSTCIIKGENRINDFGEHNRPYLSNMFQTIQIARTLNTESKFNQSLETYHEAMDKLMFLIKSSVIPFETGKLLQNKLQSEIIELIPKANQINYQTNYKTYCANINDFVSATQSTNLAQMAIALNAAAGVYKKSQQIYSDSEIPAGLVKFGPPEKERIKYQQKLKQAREKWLASDCFNSKQKLLIQEIINTTSSYKTISYIKEAKKKSAKDIEWLQNIYSELIKQNPNRYTFWYGLGNIQELEKKINKANSTWHKSLEFFPDSYYLHYRLALTCANDKASNIRAIVHFKWLMKHAQSPIEEADVLIQIAKRLTSMSELTAALKCAKQSLEIVEFMDSEDAIEIYVEVKRTLCKIYLKADQTDKATRVLEDAIKKDPSNISLKLELANLYGVLAFKTDELNQKSLNNSVKWYDVILIDAPTMEGLNSQKAHLYLKAHQYKRAQNAAIKELTINPNSAAAMTILGYVYLIFEHIEKSEVMFKQALNLEPLNRQAIRGLDLVNKKIIKVEKN